ncbi:Uncharacterised protein [Acinetobacter baumannii]|nr:Uncharacterised protein [Acinetobacter baumannii]SSS49370.1 Uncharacterised protein [Acinetobacter baumannii]SSU46423.1 Uncharacterised protein [Acinetobacter baumannii]
MQVQVHVKTLPASQPCLRHQHTEGYLQLNRIGFQLEFFQINPTQVMQLGIVYCDVQH